MKKCPTVKIKVLSVVAEALTAHSVDILQISRVMALPYPSNQKRGYRRDQVWSTLFSRACCSPKLRPRCGTQLHCRCRVVDT
jgi:hypothetical protein